MLEVEDLNNKIEKTEIRIDGGKVILIVGALGAMYGILTKSDANTMSGLIVETGGLLFKILNEARLIVLMDLKLKKLYDDSDLKHDDDNDADLDGKHFRK